MLFSKEFITRLSEAYGVNTTKYQNSKGEWCIGVEHLLTDDDLKNGYVSLGSNLSKEFNIETGLSRGQVFKLFGMDCAMIRSKYSGTFHSVHDMERYVENRFPLRNS